MKKGKIILITGGTGSWGHELVRQLLNEYEPKEIRIYSRGEHKQVSMRQEFNDNSILRFIIGDVRDKNILDFSMKNVDYVFHLAALKHVPVCEENTWEAVLTNIYGTQNVIECAISNGVKKVIDVSTDKAVDPFNHYGVTKACAEKMIVNAGFNYLTNTQFVCIRGGNVLGTNGSVIPLFKKQIETNNEITVTDPNMTRYLMSTIEAIGLLLEAVRFSKGGEIFVMRMPATTVGNIAEALIGMFGDQNTSVRIVGARAGEKIDEVLVSRNEAPHTKVIGDKYYVILPHYNSEALDEEYIKSADIENDEFTSRNALQLDVSLLSKMLRKEAWLNTK